MSCVTTLHKELLYYLYVQILNKCNLADMLEKYHMYLNRRLPACKITIPPLGKYLYRTCLILCVIIQ